jgi:hypothetical protein
MAKKQLKPKQKKTPQKKKRATTRRPKTIAEQIDAFDWRDVKQIHVGEGMVGRESSTRPKK